MSENAERRLDAERRLEEGIAQASARSRWSIRGRVLEVRRRSWLLAQASIAAGLAWFIAQDLLGHPAPVFAPVVALICLGTTYAQRLRRVAEVTVGVAVGILVADLFVIVAGNGAWQLMLVTATAMSVALLLDAGPLLVTQAGVQSIFVVALTDGSSGFTRWIDALVGGAVALLAAIVVPSAPLRAPRLQAAVVASSIGATLRGAAEAARLDDVELASSVLAAARGTEQLVRELEQAADEGMDVIASSPLLRPQRGQVSRVAGIIEPLDRALRSTRVLARRVVVATSTRERLPASYLTLLDQLADALDHLGHVIIDNSALSVARPPLVAVAQASGDLERTGHLSSEVVLAQLRSVVVDLLQVTGLDLDDALAAVPPVRPL